jgi:hypothetical protein
MIDLGIIRRIEESSQNILKEWRLILSSGKKEPTFKKR